MRDPDGPTARIIRRALSQPGGVITWGEARLEYIRSSLSAQREVRGPSTSSHFHMSLHHVLRRHFVKVEGVRGYYVHVSMLEGEE